ncbi:NAD(P)/FAD-dependent oxidoreductase [Dokdonia sinensis]|uniref:NAD(P)/FAD-dependent oxidoreductase n=1 Tax=Dokdonia sinensis TaxID=2479847 RepID=A0A3M0GBX0_9FLAO|nr:NAD(P)/FAD-dependent oxidoreductase [Dokdonia sinensis]RMB58559.1 NAD(P)/FAD-dependent oxidoreductase [Dokdonia sinensis]
MNKHDVIIIGGGAAGFFTAINVASSDPSLRVSILERGKEVLTKVRISGGGRCNVTHAEFVPKDLSENYPRGEKELLGPFHTFMTGDTIAWFEERGVELKIEEDGRMFPTSDSSQTIIDCFLKDSQDLGISVLKNHSVQEFEYIGTSSHWKISTTQGDFLCDDLVIATGSNPKVWKLLQSVGHTVSPAVPSLFTFNIKDNRIKDLMGLATEASVEVMGTKLASQGPLLITHWGMSGPGILKLSAWGAQELAATKYNFDVKVNWLVHFSPEDAMDALSELKIKFAKQSPHTYAQFELPKRLWQNLLLASSISNDMKWADLNKVQLLSLSNELTSGIFRVSGKSTFKEEFVTAGGVDLKEVNFKTFASKVCEHLYFAGEVLNIDAITGGFNFQNAWTGGYIVAQAIVNKKKL